MSVVVVVLVASVALFLISASLCVGLPPAKRYYEERYRKMDDRRLVEMNVTARTMRKRLQAFAWIIPIPLALSLALAEIFVRDQSLTTGLVCAMILLISSSLSARHMFEQFERIAASELEYRKFKQETEGQSAQPGAS